MGWKTLRDAMGITHQLEIDGDKINIGSGYMPELVAIDMRTGIVTPADGFTSFLTENYPNLAAAAPADVLALIQAEDTFDASITVYSYSGSTILESLCEVPGYPNTTHAGEKMFENTHSTDKAEVVEWAKRNARSHVEGAQCAIERAQKDLEAMQGELAKSKQWVAELDAQYPASESE